MKKYMVLLAIVLSIMAGNARAQGLALWGITGDGADHMLSVRLGLEQGPVEVGVAVKGFTAQPEWGPEIEAAGPYVLLHGPAFDLGILLRPYGGAEVMFDPEGTSWRNAFSLNKLDVNYIAGVLLSTDPNFGWALSAGYSTGQGLVAEGTEHVWGFGLRLKY